MASPPCCTTMTKGQAKASTPAKAHPAGNQSRRSQLPSRCQSNAILTTSRINATPKPIPLTNADDPNNVKNAQRAVRQRLIPTEAATGSPAAAPAQQNRSKATIAQETRHARRTSVFVSQPRTTVHAVVV